MLLHLVTDQKFIDSAQASFERASHQGNEFIVITNSNELEFIHSLTPRRITPAESLDPGFLATLSEYDAVFLHSLNNSFRLIVDAAPRDVKFIWIGWGYDYYHLIDEKDGLLLPLTLQAKRNLEPFYKRIFDFLRSLKRKVAIAAAQPSAAPRTIRAEIRLRKVKAMGRDENDVLDKLFLFAPVLKSEYRMIKKRHPDFSVEFADWNYGLPDTLDYFNQTYNPSDRSSRIVIGNSASFECNHLDTFDWLRHTQFKGEIICPLSYGDRAYGNMVSERGRNLFGERFIPITDFLPLDEYASLIASSSHMIMNHKRQQGLGNIIIALCAGTRVVLRKENPLLNLMNELGIDVCVLNDDFIFLTERQDICVTYENRAALQARFGPSGQLRRTRLLIEKSTGMRR